MNYDSWLKVRCPSCDAVQLAPPGGQAQCYACQRPFLVPQLDLPPASARAETRPAAPPASPAPTVPSPHTTADERTGPAPGASAATGEEQGRQAQGIPLSYVLIVAGLLVAATLAAAMTYRWVRRSEVSDAQGSPSAASPAAQATPQEELDEPVRWTDASQVSLRSNQLLVGIPRVEYAEVLGRDQSNRTIASDGKRYLLVHLKIQNTGTRVVGYRSWYGNAFDDDGVTRVAQLADEFGRSFDLMVFADARAIKGHVQEAELAPGNQIGDLLVFELPAAFAEKSPNHLLLELPALACGGTGFYRFRIPCTMIEGWEGAVAPESEPVAPQVDRDQT